MSDFEQMPMEPEFSGNFFIQSFQNMELYLNIVILVLILLAVITLGVYKAYSNWDKITKKTKKLTIDAKAIITGSEKKKYQRGPPKS